MIDIKRILVNGLASGFIEAVEHTIEKDIIGKGYCQLNFDINIGQQVEKYLILLEQYHRNKRQQ